MMARYVLKTTRRVNRPNRLYTATFAVKILQLNCPRKQWRCIQGMSVKVHTLDIAPLRSETPPQKRSCIWHVFSRDFTVLPTLHTFIRNRNEPYLPLPSQPQLVLIYRPQRDGRLSRPWCEVAHAEIRTRNLPNANPALYHTATSAVVTW